MEKSLATSARALKSQKMMGTIAPPRARAWLMCVGDKTARERGFRGYRFPSGLSKVAKCARYETAIIRYDKRF